MAAAAGVTDGKVTAGQSHSSLSTVSTPRSMQVAIARSAVFSLGILAAGLALLALLPPGEFGKAYQPSPWWVAVFIAAGFVTAEFLTFSIEYRREAVSITLVEVPAAFALIFLSPEVALAARVLGVLCVHVVVRRVAWFKVFFNVAVCVFDLAIAFVLLRLLEGVGGGASHTVLLLLVVVSPICSTVTSTCVMVVISIFEGDLASRLRSGLLAHTGFFAVSGVVGAIAVAVAVLWPPFTVIVMIPILAVWNVLRVHGRSSQRLRDLEEVHMMTSSVGRSLHRADVIETAIDELQRLMRSDRVTLVTFQSETGAGSVAAAIGEPFDDLPSSVFDSRWRPFLDASEAVLLSAPDIAAAGLLLGSHQREIIVAGIRDQSSSIGLLVIGDRAGAENEFVDGDVVRAGVLAGRLGFALRNAQLHEQIEHEARHDNLTGLPNRAQFERELTAMIASLDESGYLLVALLGIDRFRDVNATLGHQAGDQVLIELARRIGAELAAGDLIGRMAGDEFAVAIHVAGEAEDSSTARRLLAVAQRSYSINEFDIALTVNIGTVTDGTPSLGATTLLRRADMAMHWAKSNHTGLEPYRDEIDRRTPARLSMLSDLRLAIERRELDVFFQPKLDLATSTIIGAEALVRWHHAERGFVPPSEFVPLAENTGLMPDLTEQVLQRSVATIRLLNDLGFRLEVAVNLSTLDLLDEQIIDRVERCLVLNGVNPNQLTLEITETALLADGPRTLATAEGLERLGVHLSIDDFGTGFSSLSYLRVLPAAELKVDRSFVTNLLADERDEVIVRSTIDLGHNLGLRVVAEGVEDLSALDRLRLLGCDLAQGYGISEPLAFDRFLVWLNSGRYEIMRGGSTSDTDQEPVLTEAKSVRIVR